MRFHLAWLGGDMLSHLQPTAPPGSSGMSSGQARHPVYHKRPKRLWDKTHAHSLKPFPEPGETLLVLPSLLLWASLSTLLPKGTGRNGKIGGGGTTPYHDTSYPLRSDTQPTAAGRALMEQKEVLLSHVRQPKGF